MKIQALVVVALAAALSFSFTAAANTVEAGLSGQCYNEDASEGGGGAIVVGDENSDLTNADEVESIAAALVMFGSGTAEDNGNTGSACDRYDCRNSTECDGRPQRTDYLEVHASVLGEGVQVCYEGSASTSGNCPTNAPGPGQDN